LTKNQTILGNESLIYEKFNFADTHLTHLYLGRTYFNMMRSWGIIINTKLLYDFDSGILDYTSLVALMRFLPQTNLKRLKITINKSCDISSLEFLFKIISLHIFQSKTLKKFTFINAYSPLTFEKYCSQIETFIVDYIVDAFKASNTLHEILFNDNSEFYTLFKECAYIKPQKYSNCLAIVILSKNIFFNSYEKYGKDIVNRIIKFLYADFKQIKY
jgi:hypothetical protein